MSLPTDTVAVPVTKGVNLNTPGRLVAAGELLEATNSRFTKGGGSFKRRGYKKFRVRSQSPLTANYSPPALITPSSLPYGDKVLSPSWLWGWGYIQDTKRATNTDLCGVSPYPDAGYLFGNATRDSEVLSWNGYALYSYSPGSSYSKGAITSPAVVPAVSVEAIAKNQRAQKWPSYAKTTNLELVSWLDVTTIRYSIYDTTTRAPIVLNANLGFAGATQSRAFSLGSWLHIATRESDTTLQLRSINESDPLTVVARTIGRCVTWDMWKVDENTALFLVLDDANALKMFWIRANGTAHPSYSTSPAILAGLTLQPQVACCVSPQTGNVGVVVSTTGASFNPYAIVGATFTPSGSPISSATLYSVPVAERDNNHRLTIAPKYLLAADGQDLFDAYLSMWTGTDWRLIMQRFTSVTITSVTKWHHYAASHAYSVGDRTYIISGFNSLLQSSWFLLDERLCPVGKLDFGISDPDTGATAEPTFINLNFNLSTARKDLLSFHFAVGYRQRVPASKDQLGLYTEPGIQKVRLDFLPKLRSAQAGRATYFAGAQLGSYDGAEFTEAGFHLAPECTFGALLDSGALTASSPYFYRVDLCYKNAQNEEVRSHSFLYSLSTNSTQKTIQLVIPSVMTTRTNSYFLIFRTAILSGVPTTTLNLINSRNPTDATFLANTQSTQSFTFTDAGAVTDIAGVSREAHPANSGVSYLHPFSAPASEVIGAGRDRLWVAGGELAPGQIAPSRLFQPGEIPAFNGNIWTQIDRSILPITAVGFVGEVAIFFRENQAYVQDGDGPDNVGSGFWPPARLALTDVGALTQESLALVPQGLIFQSSAGYRMVGPGGALSQFGEKVDGFAKSFVVVGSIVADKDQEVRWVSQAGTLVYNYLYDTWSQWTVSGTSAVRDPTSGLAIISHGADFWVESEDFFLDGDAPYEHRVRFGWLRMGNLGDFGRLRRFAAFGSWDPNDGPHKIRAEIYYDERDFLEEYWEWNFPDASNNSDTWGQAVWGSGRWGDNPAGGVANSAVAFSPDLHDSVWRWRRRPGRQKCSVFSIVISDNFTAGPGFGLFALGLELGKKTGLDRIPSQGGSGAFKGD